MPFIVNGEKVNFKDKTSPFVKDYEKREALLDELAKSDPVFTFRMSRMFLSKDSDGRPKNSNGFMVRAQRFMVTDNGSYDVRYYTNSTYDSNGVEHFQPNMVEFRKKKLKLDIRRDKDLIYFLLFISPNCDSPVEFMNWQNKVRAQVWYEVENREKDARAIIDLEKIRAKVSFMILDDDYGFKVDKLRDLCYAYKIKKADKLSKPEMQQSLLNKVILTSKDKKYNAKVMDEFLKNVEADDILKIKSLIGQLVEKNKIAHTKPPKGNPKWKIKGDDGNYKIEICEVPRSSDPRVGLEEYLKENKTELESLEKLLATKK